MDSNPDRYNFEKASKVLSFGLHLIDGVYQFGENQEN